MTDTAITAAALSDADNLPLTADEIARIGTASVVRRVRARTGLSQDRFAKRSGMAGPVREWRVWGG